jgi:hypothetical protein
VAIAFVDTSIQIARVAHRPEIQDLIKRRIKSFDRVVSSLIVRQEFKRRLLKDARYVLETITDRGSYRRAFRHIHDSLRASRKQRMSIQLLLTIDETAEDEVGHHDIDEQDTDADRTDRAKLLLRTLILIGVKTSEAELHQVIQDSNCACSKIAIREKRPFVSYDFGPDKCSKAPNGCGIGKFLADHAGPLKVILDKLESLPAGAEPGQKSDELIRAEEFIKQFFNDPSKIESLDPCSRVGDLLIALESCQFETMYTMNGKESQHLAKSLGQTLVVQPPNPDNPELVFDKATAVWPNL